MRTYILSRHIVLSPLSYIYIILKYTSLFLSPGPFFVLSFSVCVLSLHTIFLSLLSLFLLLLLIMAFISLSFSFIVPASLWPAGEFSPCIFQWRSTRGEHVAPSWRACINIRLIMLVARRLRAPVDHRCVQIYVPPARATVKLFWLDL